MDARTPPASGAERPLTIALVAGETSGDNLGSRLIESLRARLPTARFCGVAGPRMQAAGCEAWAAAEDLAVMGLAEVLRHLPRLLSIRRAVRDRLLADPPDVFVGIDAPEFNLGLAARLKTAGIRTVQYVSPQVWAWRQGRVRRIGRAVDLVLCLLPFEQRFYDEHGIRARFVGHPLADAIPLESDRAAARRALHVDAAARCIAVLPGSRLGEVSRLGPDFAATLAWIAARVQPLEILAPMANAEVRNTFAACLAARELAVRVRLLDGQADVAMAAADAVLLASGTATLEATLIKRPMVVAYRLSAFTTFLLRNLGLMKAPFFAQPNLLAGRQVVPEYFNEAVRSDVLGPALLEQLERPDLAALEATFREIHLQLRRDASRQAADAIVTLLTHDGRVGAAT